ncbi:hypothetical protein GCM10028777_34130 [Angustibacter speluncae]
MDHSVLDRLIGSDLGSVVFVRDYLQLDLDAGRLTLLVWPVVVTGTGISRFGDPGYRDVLCSLIGHPVTSTTESSESGLVLRFEAGELVVRPAACELGGPEIALLDVPATETSERVWMCWRPGEGVFADVAE